MITNGNFLTTNCTFRSNSFLSIAFCFAWRIRSTCFPDIPLHDPLIKSQVKSHLTGSCDDTSLCERVDVGDTDRTDPVNTVESSSSMAIRSGSGTITGVERPEDNCPENKRIVHLETYLFWIIIYCNYNNFLRYKTNRWLIKFSQTMRLIKLNRTFFFFNK